MKLINDPSTSLRLPSQVKTGDIITRDGRDYEVPHAPIVMPDKQTVRVDLRPLDTGVRTYIKVASDTLLEVIPAPKIPASSKDFGTNLGSMFPQLDEWSPSTSA